MSVSRSRTSGNASCKAKLFMLLVLLCALKQTQTLFSLSPESFGYENWVQSSQIDWRVALAMPEMSSQERRTAKVDARKSHPRVVIHEFHGQSTVEQELPAHLSSLLSMRQESSFFDRPSAADEGHDAKKMENFFFMQSTPEYQRDCVPMSNWQTKSFPNCNSIHEIDLSIGLNRLGNGLWRQTCRLDMLPGVVVKLFPLSKKYAFDIRAFESLRVDAIIAERLTFSRYINPIYGFCGTTSIYKQAQGSLERVLKYQQLSASQKLRYSFQLAQGLADLHGIDYPDGSNSTVVHRDMKIENTLLSDSDIAQIDDFNDSKLRLWNKTSGNSPCPHYNMGFPAHWCAGFKPYEFADTSHPPLTEKIDVYGLGGLLYTLLVGHRPYYKLGKETVRHAVENGIVPTIPSHLYPITNDQTSEGLRVLVKAIHSCMEFKPEARPTAKNVADWLRPYAQDG